MEISQSMKLDRDGMFEIAVDYFETTPDGKGQAGHVSVWVKWQDSVIAMRAEARDAARGFLERALAAHDREPAQK